MSPKELQDYLLENWELLSRKHGVFCSCCGGRVIDAHIMDGAVLLSVARNVEDRLAELVSVSWFVRMGFGLNKMKK